MYESACDTKKLSYKGLTVLYVTDCDHKKSEFTKIPSNIYTTSSNKPCRKIVKVSFGLNYNGIKISFTLIKMINYR